MKLSELKTLAESKMSERHQDLQDAVAEYFNLDDGDKMVLRIVDYLNGEGPELKSTYKYVLDALTSMIPPGAKEELKAREEDPEKWVEAKLNRQFWSLL